MKNRFYLFVFALVFLVSCNTPTANKDSVHINNVDDSIIENEKTVVDEDEKIIEEASFEIFAESFLSGIETFDDLFFYTKAGTLYVVDNPGAFNVLHKIEKDSDTQIGQYLSFNTQYNLEQGALPTFSCDTEMWNKEGSFWNEEISNYISTPLHNSIEYVGKEYDAKTVSEVTSYAINSSFIIRCTDIEVTFYFEKHENEYYLYALDIVTNCSA